MLFQHCAWVDKDIIVQIAKVYEQDPAFKKPDSQRMFFCDNLSSHSDPDFVEAMQQIGKLQYFPANVTDMLQTCMPLVKCSSF